MAIEMKEFSILVLLTLAAACEAGEAFRVSPEVMAALGRKYKDTFAQSAEHYKLMVKRDPGDVPAQVGLAEANIMLYIFGFSSREETLPAARAAYERVQSLDSKNSRVRALSGKLSMLDWKWEEARSSFLRSVALDGRNKDARHWYALWLAAMQRPEQAMSQSDAIMAMDPAGDYRVGRGSLFYFERRFDRLKELMLKSVSLHPSAPWGYDWLGMAYNGLKDHQNAITTYQKAFELSDGTVEVAAGLGHALGLAGQLEAARKMAEFYSEKSKEAYIPPVQRAFIHLGIHEYEQAIELLEQAYAEKSWFIIFIQIEPWYDPIRKDPRFTQIMKNMRFPSPQ